MKSILFSFGLTLVTAGGALCQNTAPAAGYEVTSVRPSDPGSPGMRMGGSPNGDFNASGITLKALIQQAYDLRDFEISGGPGWIESERFDVIAKGAGIGVTAESLRTMSEGEIGAFRAKLLLKLQILLADRFQLKVHRETKEMPVYGLAIAKSGLKLPAPSSEKIGGSISISRGETGKSKATAEKLTMLSLVKFLSGQVGRTVLDQTGLDGQYDFTLTFSPDLVERSLEPGGACDAGPSIFTALQEQLGLRLEPQKGPVEVLVVDSVEKPAAN